MSSRQADERYRIDTRRILCAYIAIATEISRSGKVILLPKRKTRGATDFRSECKVTVTSNKRISESTYKLRTIHVIKEKRTLWRKSYFTEPSRSILLIRPSGNDGFKDS